MSSKHEKPDTNTTRRKGYSKRARVDLSCRNFCNFSSLRERQRSLYNSATINFMIAFLGLWGHGFAADKPNFSGTWTLDKDKSFSNPAGLEQTMTVTHSADQIKLEGKQ